MMIAEYMLQIFFTFGIASVSGFVNLACSSSRPYLGDPLSCTCTTDSSTGIEWQNDGGSFLSCYSATGACTTIPAEYEVANNVSGTSKTFQITIKSFSYTNCGDFICSDQDDASEIVTSLSLYAFNPSVPASITENVPSDSGEIFITTDCLYRKEEIKTTWYTISEGLEEEYTPDSSYSTPSACASDVCGAETAYTLKNGFNYVKATKNPQKVKFKVKMYHTSNTSLKLEQTTADDYYIEGSTTTSPPTTSSSFTTTPTTSTATNPPTTTPKNLCDHTCIRIIVPIIVVAFSVCFLVCCLLRRRRNIQKKKDSSKEVNSNQPYDNDIVMTSDTRGYGENNRL